MPLCVLDTEATGYASDGRASVMEVGAVMLSDQGEALGEFTSLVRPVYRAGAWCRTALEMTGITEAELLRAPVGYQVWGQLLGWMGQFKPVHQVVCWNVQFDRKIMEKSFVDAQWLPWAPCLMRAASRIHRDNRKGYKLEEAAAFVGWSGAEAHRALPDARMAAAVLSPLLRDGLWEEAAEFERKAAEKSAKRKAAKAERDRKKLQSLRALTG